MAHRPRARRLEVKKQKKRRTGWHRGGARYPSATSEVVVPCAVVSNLEYVGASCMGQDEASGGGGTCCSFLLLSQISRNYSNWNESWGTEIVIAFRLPVRARPTAFSCRVGRGGARGRFVLRLSPSLPVPRWNRRVLLPSGPLRGLRSSTMAPPPRPASPAAFLPPAAYGASAAVPPQRPLSPRPRAVVGPPPPVAAARASSWTGTWAGSWTRCPSPLSWNAAPAPLGGPTGRLPGVVSVDDVRAGGRRAAPPSAPVSPPLPQTTMAADRVHRAKRVGGVTAPSLAGGGVCGSGGRPSTADGDGGDGGDAADAPPVRRVRLLPRVHVPRAVGSALAVLRVGGARGRPVGGGGGGSGSASWAVDAGPAAVGGVRQGAAGRRGVARPLPVRPHALAAGVLSPPSPPRHAPVAPPRPAPVAPRPSGVPRPPPPAPVMAPAVASPPVAPPPAEAAAAAAAAAVKARRGRQLRSPRPSSAPPTARVTVPPPQPPPVTTPVVKRRRGRPRLSPSAPPVEGAAAPAGEPLPAAPGVAAEPRRRRGRPRLLPSPPPVVASAAPAVEPSPPAAGTVAKPRRGRPPRRPVVAASLTVEAPCRRGRPPASASAPVVALPASAGAAVKRPPGRPPRVPRMKAGSGAVGVVAPTAPTRVSLVLPSPLHPLPLNEPAPVEAAPRVRKPHSYWNELRNVETELVAANVALVSLASVSFLVYFCLLWCAGVPLTFFFCVLVAAAIDAVSGAV